MCSNGFIETWAQFHQDSTYSFCARRFQKHKKIQMTKLHLLTLSGSTSVKAASKMLMKLTPGNPRRRGKPKPTP